MSKIRINDLARELEVKSKAILDALPEVGVTEKKTHSSSVEEHEAEKVRAYLRAANEAQAAPKQSRSSRADSDEIKTKIDLSNISRPGDVLNAIRKQQAPVAASAPAARPPVSATPAAPSASPVKTPPPPPACGRSRRRGWLFQQPRRGRHLPFLFRHRHSHQRLLLQLRQLRRPAHPPIMPPAAQAATPTPAIPSRRHSQQLR